MKIQWKPLLVSIAIPLAVGGIAAFFSGGGMKSYEMMNQPALSPPAWLFPVVWTILYALMGISSYLILTSGEEQDEIRKAILLYGVQLLVNFLWPTFFFSYQWYFVSLVWLLLLVGLVAAMIGSFYKIRPVAAYLNLPYFLWLLFATYLNFAVWRLN